MAEDNANLIVFEVLTGFFIYTVKTDHVKIQQNGMTVNEHHSMVLSLKYHIGI